MMQLSPQIKHSTNKMAAKTTSKALSLVFRGFVASSEIVSERHNERHMRECVNSLLCNTVYQKYDTT